MGIISNLFATKKVANEEEKQKGPQIKKTYEQWGFEKAGIATGDIASFIPALQAIKIQCEDEQRKDEEFQQKERLKVEREISELHGQIENLKVQQNAYESELKNEENKIENAKKELADIKENPKKVLEGGQEPSKMSFVIGLVIILFLTLYLFVFYSSASYSTFFKEFTINNGTGIVDKILDSQTISKAWIDGMTEFIFICTIPFVFLGLGFLIHKFNQAEGKVKYLKITMLFIVTFIFDTILAYTITKKIYDLNAANSFQDMPPYDISMAFQSMNFWSVIFAGFIVYVIWGFVFDFMMEEYYKLDKVSVRIKELEQNIKNYKQTCNKLKESITDTMKQLNTKDSEKNSKINELNYMTIVNKDIVALELNHFTIGWLNYMSGAGKSKPLQDEVRTQSDNFINQYKQQNSI